MSGPVRASAAAAALASWLAHLPAQHTASCNVDVGLMHTFVLARHRRNYLEQLLPQLQQLPSQKRADPYTKVYVSASQEAGDPSVMWHVSMKRNRMPYIEAEYSPSECAAQLICNAD